MRVGDINQLLYLQQRYTERPRRVLEVGSKQYGNTQDFRALFRDAEYVGVDMQPGDGVDVVHDFTTGTGPLDAASFDLVICCSVLEHVRRPWVAAENIMAVMAPGAALYLVVPWVWRFHGYPDDYFRFSWRGIQELFPLAWRDFMYSSSRHGEFWPCENGADNARAIVKDDTKFLPYLQVHGIGVRPENSP
jgi:SAM-dependent methyltransferase